MRSKYSLRKHQLPASLPRSTNKRARLFLTADEHYHHRNICRYQKRPFASLEEMNSALIVAHNTIVGPNDHTIHVGDFCFGGLQEFIAILTQLHGHHYFLDGSHDDALAEFALRNDVPQEIAAKATLLPKLFETTFNGVKIVLCHYAMAKWWCSHHGSLHAYGHSHGHYTHPGRAIDVGVDCHGFNPIPIERFIQIASEKPIVQQPVLD